MTLDVRAAYRAWSTFRGAPPATRAFLAARLAVVPIGAMDAELRALSGRLLSLGCGYGLVERYLAMINDRVTVVGLELDPSRVRVAAATAPRRLPVEVRQQDVTAMVEKAGYDAALALDVMHHVPATHHLRVATALHDQLRPGGCCLVKDIDTTPAWKYRWNRFHDRVVAGPEPVHCRAMAEMAAIFERAGFSCQARRRLHPLSPYPHYLLVLRRPAGGNVDTPR